MATEPYVVANPYVSPPILPNEATAIAPNQAIINQAPTTQTDTVSTNLVAEVLQTVQQDISPTKNVIFENAEAFANVNTPEELQHLEAMSK